MNSAEVGGWPIVKGIVSETDSVVQFDPQPCRPTMSKADFASL